MSRATRILAIALAAIVVLAVIAAVVSAGRTPARLAAGTPEATVQSYLDEALDRRYDEAARFFDTAGSCSAEDLERASYRDDVRVLLVESATSGDTATVRVEIVYPSGDPFGTSEYTEDHTYRLTRSGGTWHLTGTPWPLFDCIKEK